MIYDLSNPLHKEQFKTRVNHLFVKGCIVDLTEKKSLRTLSQNRYLHAILGYFAIETGNTLQYVKEEYFKKLVNPETFIVEKEDHFAGKITTLRSTAEIDTAEMTICIERFRNWSSSEAGIYLASPDEENLIQLMEMEIDRNKRYL